MMIEMMSSSGVRSVQRPTKQRSNQLTSPSSLSDSITFLPIASHCSRSSSHISCILASRDLNWCGGKYVPIRGQRKIQKPSSRSRLTSEERFKVRREDC
jgi:hypothetical protein